MTTVELGCTYSNAATVFDATIVGTRNDNDFRFYGVTAEPGISLTQTATNVQISQIQQVPMGLYMNLGQDVQYNNNINYIPQLDSSGFGQYNSLYTDVITIPTTGPYLVSWLVSHIGTSLNVFFELEDGTLFAQSRYKVPVDPRPNSVSSSRILDLVAGQQFRLRVSAYDAGTLLLSKSYLTMSTA